MNSYNIPYGERKMASTEPTSIRDDSNSQSEHDSIESDSYIDQTVRVPIYQLASIPNNNTGFVLASSFIR